MKRSAIVLFVLALPSAAFAGGFEFPDNGTEALGRGATFTAKADSPLAIQYNVAGLARQRGTKLLFDSNIVLQDFEFTRSGSYPVENVPGAMTPLPYSGMPFGKNRNQAGPFFAPFLGLTTDFNKFDRLTFAFGVFGPSSFGNKVWGATVKTATGDAPAPQRYDVVQANLLLMYPTLAAAVRVTKWLDLGLALHLVVGIFDLQNTSITDLGSMFCPNLESANCDSTTHLRTNGVSATGGLGLMLHPHRTIDIGFNARLPIVLNTSGTVDATPPPAVKLPLPQDKATFDTRLPPVVRLGVRYKFLGSRPVRARRHRDRRHLGRMELGGKRRRQDPDRSARPIQRHPPDADAPLSGHLQRPRRRRLQCQAAGRRADAAPGRLLRFGGDQVRRTRASTSTPWPSTAAPPGSATACAA